MPNTIPELLRQVIDNQTSMNGRIEKVSAGVANISARFDEQDIKIKCLTEAILGNGENPGLVTKMALAQDHIKRIEDRLDKRDEAVDKKLKDGDDQTDSNKADLKEIVTKFKMITALLGLGGGAAGVGIAKLLELVGG